MVSPNLLASFNVSCNDPKPYGPKCTFSITIFCRHVAIYKNVKNICVSNVTASVVGKVMGVY
jgi:hypothetical protein